VRWVARGFTSFSAGVPWSQAVKWAGQGGSDAVPVTGMGMPLLGVLSGDDAAAAAAAHRGGLAPVAAGWWYWWRRCICGGGSGGGDDGGDGGGAAVAAAAAAAGRGIHPFPIQLNLSSSVHRITRLSS